MILWFILTEDIFSQPVPLYDSVTGAPSVFLTERAATAECDELNMQTDGGYCVGKFESDK